MIRFEPPPELHAGPFTLNSHGLFFLLGALATYFWGRARLPERYRVHADSAATWMTLGGVLGARLLFVAINPGTVHNPLEVFAIWQGGLVSYGGLVGALLAWHVYLRVHRLPGPLLNDALGPPALLGWGIGRIGCLLNWHNEYGTVTDVPWAFVVGSDPPRHPVMLYLAVGNIVAALLVARVARARRLRADGLALMAYGGVRFVFDHWRYYDPDWLHLGSYAVCAALFAAGLYILLRGAPPEDVDEPDPGAAPPD